MKIHQLCVFAENKPGRLRAPCEVLAKEGLDIVTLCLADTQQYGILRMIVRQWQRAQEVLEAAGFVVKVAEVVAVEVPDRPGGLAGVLRAVEQAGVNVEYMYAFAEKLDDKAILIFRFQDHEAALQALAKSPVTLVSTVDLFARWEK
jgi:hypothetical protein